VKQDFSLTAHALASAVWSFSDVALRVRNW